MKSVSLRYNGLHLYTFKMPINKSYFAIGKILTINWNFYRRKVTLPSQHLKRLMSS